jgi:hypothetical protein
MITCLLHDEVYLQVLAMHLRLLAGNNHRRDVG